MKRIIVVTGASAGLGAEFARQLDHSRQPDELWLVARRRDRLEALAKELRPGVGRVVEADLGTMAGCTSLARQLDEAAATGGIVIDCFVNNAGFGSYGPFAEIDRAWQLGMIDLNVRALTHLAHAAQIHMAKGSFLINVGSLAAYHPLGGFAVYGASKAYVLSFSYALGAELRQRGIKVCALCPGPTDTEFSKVASRGKRELVMHSKATTKVVAHCLKKAQRGRHVAVLGLDWKFQAVLARFLGKGLVANLTQRFMVRPH